jgi:phosphate-selective porin OprO/OprP
MEEHGMFRSKRFGGAGLVLAGALTLSGGPLSAEPQPTRAELEDRVRRLEDIIRKHGLDKPSAPPAAAPAAPAGLEPSQVEQIVDDKLKKQKVLAGWEDGFFLESPNGDFKLKLRGYAQADMRFFPLEERDTGTDSLFLRRVRPIFEGTVFKYFDFRIMPDFGGGSTTLQDAYMDVKYLPYARLRAGKYKNPLSLERLESGAELLFVERSIANNLAPSRDVGLGIFGDVLDGALSYQASVFNGTVDSGSSDGDTTSDKEVGARIFTEPFRNLDVAPLKGLGIGAGGNYGNQKEGDNLSGVQYRTAGRSTFFHYATSSSVSILADGDRSRFAPGGYYFWGPVGLMAEYIHSQQGARRTTSSSESKETFTNRGWFAQASWVLTGEDASFKMVNPINPFDPRNGRWGAFEVAARGSSVAMDDDIFDLGFASEPNATRSADSWAVGANWYLNRSFKLQANWEHTDFDTEILFGDDLRDSEDVFLTRFQISF